MFLIDTNVFLEILLRQPKKQVCKDFLNQNRGNLYISDFSLHSIGVLLFRYGRQQDFQKFVRDMLSKTTLIVLPQSKYKNMVFQNQNLGLDFDDLYQYCVAKYRGFSIVTMDNDFANIRDVHVIFL